jgi:hypothetical protein
MSDLASALAALQADLPPIRRTAKARTGKDGSRIYRYAAYDKILATVKPIMAKHGFVWWTRPTLTLTEPRRFVLEYELTYLKSGEPLRGYYPLKEGPAQQQGSEISYAKRYCLAAVLDLQIEGEDDDGMAASRTSAKIPGPDHERLRHGTVERTPDDQVAERSRGRSDDLWTGQPAGDLPYEPEHTGPLDSKQRSKIMRHLGKLSHTDRAARLTNITGRDIDSTNELSWAEAAEVIKILEES